jgi:hypothetical protein
MATKWILREWVVEVLKSRGGHATLVDVSREIWARHEDELRASGDLFYTWQYDVRWAATNLREIGTMRAAADSPKGVWELS